MERTNETKLNARNVYNLVLNCSMLIHNSGNRSIADMKLSECKQRYCSTKKTRDKMIDGASPNSFEQ